MRDECGNYINTWAINVKNLLQELGFNCLWENGNITHIQFRMVLSRLYDQYFQQWFSVLRTTQRLETYGLIKTTLS